MPSEPRRKPLIDDKALDRVWRDEARKRAANRRYHPDDALLPRHFLCVEYYMRGMSQIEACRMAGYSESTAETNASRVFRREDVQKAIERRRSDIRKRTEGMVERIKEEFAKIAFFNIGEILEITPDGDLVYKFDGYSLRHLPAIGEVTVESYRDEDRKVVKRIRVKPYDKKGALDSLARIHGMFTDNVNVSTESSSIEERLAKGRARLREEPIEGEFEEIE